MKRGKPFYFPVEHEDRAVRIGKLWWHSQNLNERRDGTTGPMLTHGRGWLRWGNKLSLGLEWTLARWRGIRLMFTYGADETDYGLSVALGFASLWLSLSGVRAYGSMPRGFGWDTGFYFVDDHLVFKLNCDDSSWSRADGPAHGWSKSWFVSDVLLGPAKYSSHTLQEVQTYVPMPEAPYACTVKMHRDEWRRPRWPAVKRVLRATVDIPSGIPFPGKGTASYNCGPDACYGSTLPARDVHDAVTKVAASVLRDRERNPR